MEYIRNTTDFYIEEKTALSLGKFDGFHRGHGKLMEQLDRKRKEGFRTAVFTFDIPPRKGVEGVEAKVLTTNEEKKYMFEQAGVDYLVECPFVPEIMCMEPEDFIEKIVRQLHVGCIVAGEDCRFGHKRKGDYKTLQKYAEQYGYEVVIVEKMKEEERDISSTFVREEIAKGNIKKANRLLGYRYFITNIVKHGNRIGRTIGIPTINQIPAKEKLLPPNGVYITEVYIDERKYRGVTNVGCKPTIQGENPIGVETHLLDFRADIYDKAVTVEFLDRIRPEKKFDSIEELKQQMQNDIAYARARFASQ